MTVEILSTGYLPPAPDYSGIDKRQVFSAFIRARRNLRQFVQARRDCRDAIASCERDKAQGKRSANLTVMRVADQHIEQHRANLKTVTVLLENAAYTLLHYAHQIECVADFSEQAALLGLSDTAYRNALLEYSEEVETGFTLVLSHMPADRADPDVEWPVCREIIRQIQGNPVTARRSSMFLNEMFGAEVFPVQDAPKPVLTVVE